MDQNALESLDSARTRRGTRIAGLDRSARPLARFGNPPEIVRRLNQYRKRAPYADQVEPAGFVLAPHVQRMGLPEGVDPKKFQLIAPYSSDPRDWFKLPWVDRHSRKRYAITTHDGGDSRVARVKSYRDVLEKYATHPEPKSTDADGKPCSRSMCDLLHRRPVQAESIYYVGKESNYLEDVEYGMLHDSDEVQEHSRTLRAKPARAKAFFAGFEMVIKEHQQKSRRN